MVWYAMAQSVLFANPPLLEAVRTLNVPIQVNGRSGLAGLAGMGDREASGHGAPASDTSVANTRKLAHFLQTSPLGTTSVVFGGVHCREEKSHKQVMDGDCIVCVMRFYACHGGFHVLVNKKYEMLCM